VGRDGHDRGVKIVARCLRDAGMDVICTGLHRTLEEAVAAALRNVAIRAVAAPTTLAQSQVLEGDGHRPKE
jgi:methylmalonyl-CoA mutase cobalamin-binding domain/chain